MEENINNNINDKIWVNILITVGGKWGQKQEVGSGWKLEELLIESECLN